MNTTEIITALFTFLGTILTVLISLRLGKIQLTSQRQIAELTDDTLGEVEFRKSLLQFLEQQESKIVHQETKVDKLETLIEANKTLTDELKRANLNLILENQRLQKRIEELELRPSQENQRLKQRIEELELQVSELKKELARVS